MAPAVGKFFDHADTIELRTAILDPLESSQAFRLAQNTWKSPVSSASMEDADDPVGEGSEGLVVGGATGALSVT